MKKLLPLLAWCLMLCGCGDYRELDSRDIVAGMAVDRTDDGYSLLLEIADVTAGSDDNPGARWLGLQGTSLAAAIENGAGGTGRQAYLGHTQMVIVGDETARSGIDDLLGYFQRTADVHMTLAMAVADGEAAEVYRQNEDETHAAFDLARAAVQAGKTGLAPAMPLYRFVADRLDEGVEGILPCVTQTDAGAHVTGAALFRGDVLAGRLDGELTQTLLMARGLLDRGVLTVDGGEDTVSFDIRSCSVDLKTGGQPDQIEAQYIISLTLELSQSGQDGELSAERRREYEQLAARTVEERFQTLCMELQNNYRVDSLGIGRQIHRRDPVLWAQVGTDWDSAFSDCRITAQVDAALLGGGRSLE